MVYDDVGGANVRKAYLEWDAVGQILKGTLLAIEPVSEPHPGVRIRVKQDDGLIVIFYAPKDLQGKLRAEDAGKYVFLEYVADEPTQYKHKAKKFRVLVETPFRKSTFPKKNGARHETRSAGK